MATTYTVIGFSISNTMNLMDVVLVELTTTCKECVAGPVNHMAGGCCHAKTILEDEVLSDTRLEK
jgi:hypothetical protein